MSRSRAHRRLFTFDETSGVWLPSSTTQHVDLDAHRVIATVDHFSRYTLFNIADWRETWQTTQAGCDNNPPVVDLSISIDVGESGRLAGIFGLQKSIGQSFYESLAAQDRGALVEADDSYRTVVGLTTDHAQLVSGLSDLTHYFRDSDLSQVVTAGLQALRDGGPRQLHRARVLVVITDGNSFLPYDTSVTAFANLGNVQIYPVGVGDVTSANRQVLEKIAADTGGKYYEATSTPDVQQRVAYEPRRDDYDNDGATDCDEADGAIDALTGRLFFSDPNNPDSDGDGVKDGDEYGTRLNAAEVERHGTNLGIEVGDRPIFKVLSHPEKVDSDLDTLDDRRELADATNARNAEGGDGDGLFDVEELAQGTDPNEPDTDGDGDGYGDAAEVDNVQDGFDPLDETETTGTLEYARKFAKGALCGSWCDDDSIAFLAGDLGGGLVGLSDIRDFFRTVVHGDLVGSGLSLAGLVPWAGDAEAFIRKALAYAARSPIFEKRVVGFVLRLDDAPAEVRIDVLRKIDNDAYDALASKGLDDNMIIALAKDRNDVLTLGRVIKQGAVVKRTGGRLFDARGAEDDLVAQFGGESRFYLEGSGGGAKGSRYADQYNEGPPRVGREAKSGRQGAFSFVGGQIAKDKALLGGPVPRLDRVEWHFFPNANGRVGPSSAIADRLRDAAIPITIYVP